MDRRGARAAQPGEGRAPRADLPAFEILDSSHRESGHELERVDAAACDPDLVEPLVLRAERRKRLVEPVHHAAHQHHVRSQERHDEGHVRERQLVRIEDDRDEADVRQTVLDPVEHLDRLQQRTGIGLLPLDLDIESRRLDALVHFGDEQRADQRQRGQCARRLTGGDGKTDLLLCNCRRNEQQSGQSDGNGFGRISHVPFLPL
ncbi:MAG: hypothetical protein A3H33_01775 [Betaproteobacteria bacterium RIFCSPLOWO2_02_FULL_65_20]|nr:MAG: hypothetical protein A3H33_01775 [Betaproteobacteria bacterium RIFCSPLOWO2_02_FULL_65_20]